MDYRLELLDDKRFENLTNTICQKLLGMGIVSFATGKDGGRDGKFTGTAQNYPDNINPWSGKFIIQAKHTENPIASCSDRKFKTEIVDKEIPKIKKLKEDGDIDCYMLFTNRAYTGIIGEELLKTIIKQTGVEKSVIIGKETINNDHINPNKDIVKLYELDKHHIPFDFSEKEIKEIILTLKSQLSNIQDGLKAEVQKAKYNFDHIEKQIKNKKNKLSEAYYQNEILDNSLMDFAKIEYFLSDSKNSLMKDYYFDISSELSALITLKRDNFDAFEAIFIYIYKSICDGCDKLMGSKRHVLTLLHYMYFECLIGIK